MDIFLFNELSRGFKVKKINKMMKKWSKKHNSTTYGMSLIDLEIDKFFDIFSKCIEDIKNGRI